MPSYSTGFWVAATRNGAGTLRETPSTETWPSSIASSSADWVFGGVRLISSASSRLVKTGPSRKVSSPACRLSITIEPVMSPGIRSGVNCTRLVSTERAAARVRTSSVLAVPGHALHQHVAAAQQRDEQAGDRGVLADHGLADLGAHRDEPLACGP